MAYPCIKLVKPSAMAGQKNGRLPDSMLARVKTGGRMYTPVAEHFNAMYDAARAAGHKLRNVGDYRPYERQLNLFLDRYSTTDLGRSPQVARTFRGQTWYLKPGKAPAAVPDESGVRGSNHGWGLAIDLAWEDGNGRLRSMGGEVFDWMCENGPKFGFYLQTGDRGSRYWEAWHWQYCLGDAAPDPANLPKIDKLLKKEQGNQSLRKGAQGEDVKEIQRIVGATPVDGDWGPKTDKAVKAWQKEHGLKPDGIWGHASDTHSKDCDCKAEEPAPAPAPAPESKKASHPYPGKSLRIGSKGEDVKLVQGVVKAKQDGDFGRKTRRAVIYWQKKNPSCGPADGMVGPKTWGVMFG